MNGRGPIQQPDVYGDFTNITMFFSPRILSGKFVPPFVYQTLGLREPHGIFCQMNKKTVVFVREPQKVTKFTCTNGTQKALQINTGWWFFTNPSEKYADRQIGSFPQVGVKIKHI